ncbi:ImpA family type VI secretion system protein [Winslowiella iniecta]|nr:type VI secretion system ImpA family N-terminal domain-containing protein [Winslowiella iniecta]
MNEIVFSELEGVEFDPLYNEILFILAEHDNSIDPLNNQQAGEQINWLDIREKSERLLMVCHDLRVIIWFMRAGFHTLGVAALWQGIKLIDDLLAAKETVYPLLVDEPVGSGHAAALGWLSTPSCLSELKKARLASEIGLTFEAVYENALQSAESTVTFAELIVMLDSADSGYQAQNTPVLSQQLAFVGEALERIEQYANQNSDGYLLECRNLRAVIGKLAAQLSGLNSDAETPFSDEMSGEDLLADPAQATSANVRMDGKIRTRQEAILMLDRIIDYFKTYEPSHPAPIFIKRSQKMIGMEFENIVEELMPDAMSSLKQFIGK